MSHCVLIAVLAVLVGVPLGCRSAGRPVADTASLVVDSGSVAVDGVRIFYEAAGRGSPVILIHGGNLDRRMWDAQFTALAREHRVVRYDARGFGRSPGSAVPFAAHDDLLALLNALRIERAALVGLSMGGRIAIDFALAHPAMVDRLVLAAPGMSGWPFGAGDTTWIPAARAANARGDSVGIALAWLQSEFMRPAMEDPAVAERLRTIAGGNASYWAALFRRGDAERPATPPAVHRTASLSMPTLVLIGSRDARDIKLIVDTLAASVPKARRVDFEGAGHMLNMERADRFTQVVRDFLRP